MKQYFFILMLCLGVACTFSSTPSFPLTKPGYVVSGDNAYSGFNYNALTIFDTEKWQVHQQIWLPHSGVKSFRRDPQGRLWIGFGGAPFGGSDDLVQIYTPDGNLLKALHPCDIPQGGISFASGRAFIACTQNGVSGKVAVVNLATFAIEKTIELTANDDRSNLLLSASAANEEIVVVSGSTNDGPKDTSYAIVTLIDANTLNIKAQLEPLEDVDVWRIIPYKKQFYLLNVSSWRRIRDSANDIMVLSTGNPPTITPLAVAPSPLWGVIKDDKLFAYHNQTFDQPNSNPKRQFSRLDLVTKEVKIWDLPDNWDASDLGIIDDKLILSTWNVKQDSTDGLYQFQPENGKLNQLLSVIDASNILY